MMKRLAKWISVLIVTLLIGCPLPPPPIGVEDQPKILIQAPGHLKNDDGTVVTGLGDTVMLVVIHDIGQYADSIVVRVLGDQYDTAYHPVPTGNNETDTIPFRFMPIRAGSYYFNARIHMMGSEYNSEKLTIVVYQKPRIASAGSTVVRAGQLVTIQLGLTTSDPTLRYHYGAEAMPPGAQLLVDKGIFTWTPEMEHIGVNRILFTVTDNSVLKQEDRMEVRIVVKGSDSDCVAPVFPAHNSSGIETRDGVVFSWTKSAISNDGQVYTIAYGEKTTEMDRRTASTLKYRADNLRGNRTYYWTIETIVNGGTLRCPYEEYWQFKTKDNPAIISGLVDHLITIGDSITYSLSVTDPEGVRELHWDFNGDGAVDSIGSSLIVGRRYGMTPGVFKCVLQVIDSSGGITRDSAAIRIVSDHPVAFLTGPDSATVNDTIRLFGTGVDSLGIIVKYEWKIGSGAWRNGKRDTLIIAPASKGHLLCSLRVVDDDGQIAYAAHTLKITNGVPSIVFSRDTLHVGLGDTVSIAAEVKDDGVIKSYEWKKGDAWTKAASAQTVFLSPRENLPDTTMVVLRVTDEDGNSSMLSTCVISNMVWVKLTTPTDAPFNSREGFACFVYKIGTNEHIYLVGGVSLDRRILHRDVWRTADGSAWERVADSTVLGGRCFHAATTFNYRMWIHGGYDRGEGYWDNTLGNLFSSTDGTTWTRISSVPLRAEHSIVYWNSRLYVIGGGTRDRWCTTSLGTVFEKQVADIDFPWLPVDSTVVYGNGASADVLGNRLIIVGGKRVSQIMGSCEEAYSMNTLVWSPEAEKPQSAPAPFSPRAFHSSAIHQDKLFIIGGEKAGTKTNDIWYTSNGTDWRNATRSAPFLPVAGHKSFVFRNQLWIISGIDNTIWYSKDLPQ